MTTTTLCDPLLIALSKLLSTKTSALEVQMANLDRQKADVNEQMAFLKVRLDAADQGRGVSLVTPVFLLRFESN
jgi:hypothetical protein